MNYFVPTKSDVASVRVRRLHTFSRKRLRARYVIRWGILAVTVFAICLILEPLYIRSADYSNYESLFARIARFGLQSLFEERTEPLFILVVYLGVSFGLSGASLYALLLWISLFVKAAALWCLQASKGIVLLVVTYYACRHLPLHELTQLRAGMASSFLLLAWATNRPIYSMLAATIACLFHYSAIVVAPFILLRWLNSKTILSSSKGVKKPHPLAKWTLLLIIVSVAYLLTANIDALLVFAGKYSTGIDLYYQTGFGDEKITLISGAVALDLTFIFLVLMTTKKHKLQSRYLSATIIFSLLLFMGLTSLPTLAFRLRELFSIFLIPLIINMVNEGHIQRIIAFIYVVVSCVYYLRIYFFSSGSIF